MLKGSNLLLGGFRSTIPRFIEVRNGSAGGRVNGDGNRRGGNSGGLVGGAPEAFKYRVTTGALRLSALDQLQRLGAQAIHPRVGMFPAV